MMMGRQRRYSCRTKYSLWVLLYTSIHHLTSAGSFIYTGCSPSKADPSNSPFFSNLNALLSSFIPSSSSVSYNSSSVPSLYGLYQCRSDLRLTTCADCVRSAANQLALLCPSSLSAAVQLDGCLVRYSTDDFLGVPDTSLAYKRCSTATTTDGNFFRRRDDVMADLISSVGFRVSSSGTVHGYVQCLGDLDAGDCTQCVKAVVGRMKDACGGALSADVYLGKCYARYWASGYYPRIGGASEENDHGVGKMVAIIIGILAGIALVVIFLSFIRKAMSK